MQTRPRRAPAASASGGAARAAGAPFRRSLDTIIGSNTWSRENRKAVFGPTVAAVKKAFTDVGREVPDEFRSRTVGARDVSGD